VYYLFADKIITTGKEAFRVKKNIAKKLAKRKEKIRNRVEKRNWSEQPRPMLGGGNICYDVDGRHEAISYGGVSSIHQLALRSGLIPIINSMAAAGIVSLPGMMTGQILAGSPPLEAAKYQLLIMFLIASGTGLGSMAAIWSGSRRLFDERQRLRLDRLTT
jgi:hypothetical protein